MSNRKKASDKLVEEGIQDAVEQKIPNGVDPETGEINLLAFIKDNQPVIKSQYTHKHFPRDYEKNPDPSLTVPNQSMTILQMLERHRAGLPLNGNPGVPLYQGEDLIPDISQMDLVDRQEYMDMVADQLVDLRSKINNEAKTQEEKAFIARVDEEVKKHLAKMQQPPKKEEDSN